MSEDRDITAEPLRCDLCGEQFETREELRDHVRQSHERR
jgi:uncharacterized C2H2 Zn-finger protein